jgi:AcrR family transcriptional regulator
MSAAKPAPTRRTNDPEGLRRRILQAALVEFSGEGYSGARLDAIAERADTNKRMVVYHFRSKEELYIRVLERVYGEIREVEQQLHLENMAPLEALRRLVEFTFDYHDEHPEFCRLVSIENIHYAKHIAKSRDIRTLNRTVIDVIEEVLLRGRQAGIVRSEISAIDLHMLISSFSFYRVSNRHTFTTLFGADLISVQARARHREMLVEAVLAYLTKP